MEYVDGRSCCAVWQLVDEDDDDKEQQQQGLFERFGEQRLLKETDKAEQHSPLHVRACASMYHHIGVCPDNL